MNALTIPIALGIGLGVGLWAFVVWLFPPAPALRDVLARTTATPAPIASADDTGLVTRLGHPAVIPLRALGLPSPGITKDLAVVGRSTTAHLAEKAVLAVAGLLLPGVLSALLAIVALSPGLGFPFIAGSALAVLGFLWPDLRVRAEASKRRDAFRHTLSAYLDLVGITLAGGAGLDSALTSSAAIGRGWAFHQIRRALDTARLTRATPWTTLRQLGGELDVSELTELAASASLAGTEGAKVRASLAAKAHALRTRQLTKIEGDAQAATERMSLPVMALFLGFFAFITYPALAQVLNGL